MNKEGNKTIEVDKNNITSQSDHVLKVKHQVNVKFDENYKFITKSLTKKIINDFTFILACLIFPIINFFCYGLKKKGRKNYRKALKYKKGIITIANHCHVLDCTMVVSSNLPKKTWLPTVEETLRIPSVRHIIRALNVIPIPTNPRGLAKFKDTCDSLLQKKEIVHFYPEGSLWPRYDKLREFKTGAFRFAVENDCPILPYCIYYRKRRGLWKLIGRKPLITIEALPPMFANKVLKKKPAINDLMNRAYEAMKPIVEQYEIPNSDYREIEKSLSL